MKLMVSVVLLAVIWQAVDCEFLINVEEESSIKRELNEGNFGLKLKPDEGAGNETNSLRDDKDKKNDLQEKPPEKQSAPPGAGKISDAAALGASLPDTIQRHLASPVQIYQPRFESAPRFEISAPIPSQLAFSDTMYSLPPLALRLNPYLRHPLNPYVSITPPTPTNTPNLIQTTTPYLLPNLRPLTSWSPEIYQHLFPSIPGVDPRSIYHEINDLQLPYDDIFRLNLEESDTNNINAKNKEQQSVMKVASESDKAQENIKQSQVNQNASTFSQPVAFSYVSFSQRLPNSPLGTTSGQVTLQSLSLPPWPLSPRPSQSLTSTALPLPPSTLPPRPLPPLAPPSISSTALPLRPLPPLVPPLVPPSISSTAPPQTLPPLSSPSLPPTDSSTHAPRNIGVIRIRQQSSPTPPSYSQASSTQFLPPSTSPFPIFFKSLPPLKQREFPSKPTTTLRPLEPLPFNPFRVQPLQASAVSTLSPASFRPPLPSFPSTTLVQSSLSDSFPSKSLQPLQRIPTLPPLPTLPPFSPPPREYLINFKPDSTPIQKNQSEPNTPPTSTEPSVQEPLQETNKLEETDVPEEQQPIPIAQQNQVLIQTPQSLKQLEIVEQPQLDLPQTETVSDQKQPAQPVATETNASQPKQPSPEIETKSQNKQETEKFNDKSEKQSPKGPSTPTLEPKDLYAQLVHNSFYPELPGGYSLPPYLPVPVAGPPIPSFLNEANIVYNNPAAPVFPTFLPSFHSAPTAVALQYYGNYAPHIFGPQLYSYL